ncbi:MAG: DegT/DnrJ/EryC1/StrS family aminotransferase [Cyclobacteriaceae bacterium]|nr:DegT/DnrJ/EryC1/StrS family aminotransferase [Cyclobacteriaceae bacterium]
MEVYGAEERKEVMDVLETGVLFRYGHEHLRKGMWKAAEFEEEVCKQTGANYAHAVSSGTAAVTSIMAATGIGHGDEVIVPPYTFVAPIEAVFLAGALPVFAEIDETICLSPEGIEAAITPNTKAVLLIHMCGAAADLDGILEVCKKHNLVLLEDCGQAMGASYKGKSVGLHGAAGAFSFDYFKITTCGEGGMTITNKEEIYKNIDQVADHGHTHEGNNRGMEDHYIMGSNFRIGEINAAIGLAQMRKLPWILEQNRKNKKYIKDRLKKIDGLTFRKMDDESGDSATFLNFFVPTKEKATELFAQLAEDGVGGVANWYTNMYHFINQWDHIKEIKFPSKLAINDLGAPQDYKNLSLPKSEDVISRLISIGISCTSKDDELAAYTDKVITSIKKVL